MNNHDLLYRPLLCGTSIVNARIGEPGTLGYVAHDAQGSLWGISAYHVLCESTLAAYVRDEEIFQPAAVTPANRIGTTRAARAVAQLDCAAVAFDKGIDATAAQLGMGDLAVPLAPQAGMHVLKSGAVSGLTEGMISIVNKENVVVQTVGTFPMNYVLSEPGDSGSVWVDAATRSPVALHTGLSAPRRARAVSLLNVLTALQLSAI